MNKKVIVAIVILLLVGGGAYLAMSKKSGPAMSNTGSGQTAQTEVNTSVQPTASSSQKSLKDLLIAGVPQKCTYTDKLETVDVSGTSYISNGNVRADYTTVASGTTMTGHMIAQGTTSYIWSDGQKTGFKMKFDPNQTTPGATGSEKQPAVDPNKIMDYKCGPWTADNSVFTPPTDVTFTDYSSMMVPPKGMGGSPSTSSNSVACSACNSLTGDQKTECLTALKCN